MCSEQHCRLLTLNKHADGVAIDKDNLSVTQESKHKPLTHDSVMHQSYAGVDHARTRSTGSGTRGCLMC